MGYGKITPFSGYRKQSRGGRGIYAARINERTGNLVGFKVVEKEEDVMIVTEMGIIMRQSVSGISKMGRYTQGVKLIRLTDDRVVTLTTVKTEEATD